MVRVAVVGAGVNGLGCAIKIKESYPHFEVVVLAEEFSPNTTGDGSAGLWYPYLCGNTSPHKTSKWSIETYKLMHKLWLEGGFGAIMVPMYILYREEQSHSRLAWQADVFGFYQLDDKQLTYLSKLYSTSYRHGYSFTTFTQQPTKLLAYLLERFQQSGGIIKQYQVTSLNDAYFNDFDVVVNCMGLGSRHVVPDLSMHPIRGQIIRVLAPWVNQVIIDETSGHYIIPNVDFCILGGTHQENNFNTNINEEDTEHIINGSNTILPGLQDSVVIKHWAGLRPGRDEVRLEAEEVNGKLYIHNYGHGGSGVTMFWGCATEVLDILNTKLPNIETRN